jgi:hypothetical protein
MKALVIILAVLLVAGHPGAVAAVLAAEVAVCGALGWLTWQGLRAAMIPATWRRAA